MKAYIMERERFDGVDVAHILLRRPTFVDRLEDSGRYLINTSLQRRASEEPRGWKSP
jgi:hypothetical protein